MNSVFQKINNKKLVRSALLTLLVLSSFSTTSAQNSAIEISVTEKVNVKSHFEEKAKTSIKDTYMSIGKPLTSLPKINITVEYDTEKLAKDAILYSKELQNRSQEYLENTKKFLNATGESKKDNAEVTKNNELKFGRLNIGDSESAIVDAIENNTAAAQNINYSLQIDSALVAINSPFKFEALDYVNKVLVSIVTTETFSEEIINLVKNNIITDLSLAAVNKEEANSWVTFDDKSSTISAKESTIVSDILTNPNLGIVIASVILLLGFILGAKKLSSVFQVVAASISSLKPEAENDTIEAEVEEVIDAEEGNSDLERSIAAQALTAEMKEIKEQTAKLIEKHPDVTASFIRDLFYQKGGLKSFRNVLCFLGYEALEKTLSQLTPDSVEELQEYLEDNQSAQIDLLDGVEMAQRIYQDIVTNIASASEDDEISKLKEKLVKVGDKAIEQFLKDANAEQTSLIIRSLSTERSNYFIVNIEAELLKDACDLLDKKLENTGSIVSEISTKLDEFEENKAEKSRKQERFVLRLVKSASIEDEATVRELIAPENLELLKAAMVTKLFYSDIKYVNPEVLKLTLDGFPIRQRAEFIAVAEEEIKSSLLSFFEEGSKIREMLNSELELIEKNPDRSKEVQKQKSTLVNKFMTNLRNKASAKPTIIDEALLSFARANNIETPEWLAVEEGEAAA